ncbi:hypothetical protein B0H63DRAFT_527129 [Podospora didyma]|uniref:Uncharacterized protein n=1 Tax=Podospora didyma TaxID=330526 RepID=A0AAE0K8X7_9PEZI|nr:hypothetical protein B0H63DRAFT_527129 [Podospora didyma]
MAIVGIERRVLRVLDSSGSFGVIDRYFNRSLLWRPAKDEPAGVGERSRRDPVPSWSWMRYNRSIDYWKIPKTVQWLTGARHIVSPYRGLQRGRAGLGGLMGEEIVFDNPRFDPDAGPGGCVALSCVVLGELKGCGGGDDAEYRQTGWEWACAGSVH